MRYRLYIDEVGNADLASSADPNHRFLSLTGVVIEQDYAATTVSPKLEELKYKYFGSHPDEPLVLHRSDLVNKRHPFHVLRDSKIEMGFNNDLLYLLQYLNYSVLTVVIDKQEHLQRYRVWRYHPYHYCLAILLERYIRLLSKRQSTGDVMAEGRGKREDSKLKQEYERLYVRGTDYESPKSFQDRLSSKELKVRPKQSNVAGLQLADLLAHPSYRFMYVRRHNQPLPNNFGGKIAAILESQKYDRSPSGHYHGWGCKWLP